LIPGVAVLHTLLIGKQVQPVGLFPQCYLSPLHLFHLSFSYHLVDDAHRCMRERRACQWYPVGALPGSDAVAGTRPVAEPVRRVSPPSSSPLSRKHAPPPRARAGGQLPASLILMPRQPCCIVGSTSAARDDGTQR